MFRLVGAIVTIITAPNAFSGHYGTFETGVGCHFWAVTTIGPHWVSGEPEKRTSFLRSIRGHQEGVFDEVRSLVTKRSAIEKGKGS